MLYQFSKCDLEINFIQ